MDYKPSNVDEIDKWEEVQLVYKAALKQMRTKLEILSADFAQTHKYNPIEHIEARIKSSESIVKN
jgi:putative GTP pyrophosphokinase